MVWNAFNPQGHTEKMILEPEIAIMRGLVSKKTE
jgi:hypothetical protein